MNLPRLRPFFLLGDDFSTQQDSPAPLEPQNSGQHIEDPQQDPELDPQTHRRIPHLGHALLFVAFAAITLIVFQIILMLLGKSPAAAPGGAVIIDHPKLQLAAMAATYLCTLASSWFLFPLIWHRTFLDGIRWRWNTARGQAYRLIPLGFVLGAMVQGITYFITSPKKLPIDDFFLRQSDAWLLTLFGTILAPAFEEICFRGFLVPAFAIAYDWLCLPRTPEGHQRWQTTTNLTPIGLVFSAILSSIFFAMLHFEQVAHVWAATLVLFAVSLVLTFVRARTGSVACSVLVHGAYNLFVFLIVLVATGGYRHLDRMTR